jgi:hypothetical protein
MSLHWQSAEQKTIAIWKTASFISNFCFFAKVGFDRELKNSNFLREIGLFNIGKCFQSIPRIEK